VPVDAGRQLVLAHAAVHQTEVVQGVDLAVLTPDLAIQLHSLAMMFEGQLIAVHSLVDGAKEVKTRSLSDAIANDADGKRQEPAQLEDVEGAIGSAWRVVQQSQ
jgi:hypothetical protein